MKHEQLNYEKLKTQIAAKLSVIDYLAFITTAGHTQHCELSVPSRIR
ncbi:Mobile element protein [Methylomonas fluvii]|nr:Mobile element protein [Methylomonas fluvii]